MACDRKASIIGVLLVVFSIIAFLETLIRGAYNGYTYSQLIDAYVGTITLIAGIYLILKCCYGK